MRTFGVHGGAGGDGVADAGGEAGGGLLQRPPRGRVRDERHVDIVAVLQLVQLRVHLLRVFDEEHCLVIFLTVLPCKNRRALVALVPLLQLHDHLLQFAEEHLGQSPQPLVATLVSALWKI